MTKNKIPPARESARTTPPSPPNFLKRILVVEDEPLLRQIYAAVLTQADYAVDTAENGAVGWDALQSNGYDLLITDNDMPKLTGVDLLQRIYAACLSLPVIMVTGTYPGEEFSKHPWLKPDFTLCKPHPVVKFLEAVKAALGANDPVGVELTPLPA